MKNGPATATATVLLIITLILANLKVYGFISWHWIWIISPFWIPWIAVLVLSIIYLILLIIIVLYKSLTNKEI